MKKYICLVFCLVSCGFYTLSAQGLFSDRDFQERLTVNGSLYNNSGWTVESSSAAYTGSLYSGSVNNGTYSYSISEPFEEQISSRGRGLFRGMGDGGDGAGEGNGGNENEGEYVDTPIGNGLFLLLVMAHVYLFIRRSRKKVQVQ